MRTKRQWLFILGLSAIIAGCNNEKDYFQNPLDNLKPEGEYFDFATRDKVSVSLDMELSAPILFMKYIWKILL